MSHRYPSPHMIAYVPCFADWIFLTSYKNELLIIMASSREKLGLKDRTFIEAEVSDKSRSSGASDPASPDLSFSDRPDPQASTTYARGRSARRTASCAQDALRCNSRQCAFPRLIKGIVSSSARLQHASTCRWKDSLMAAQPFMR
jgi:hypothetical protein